MDQFHLIITELRHSASLLPNNSSYILIKEIDKIDDKLLTLANGHHTIQKRGLFNFLGTINKWITGTMDDEDRQIINQHLEIIGTKNHNLISNMNQQVQINDNFNTSITKLLNSIKEDRKIIQNFIKIETDKTRLSIVTFDIRLNIQQIDRTVSELQDNIILSNLNIIHPSLLTHNEIINYQIDLDKVKNLKIGFSKTSNNQLIFLIKIPYKMTLVNKK